MASRLQWHGDDARKKLAGIARANMELAARFGEGKVKEKLGRGGGPRTGRMYRVPGSTRFYRASAPGEPPAYRTGVLQAGVTSGVEIRGSRIVGMVGVADVEYAKELELGTSEKAPRPFLRPTIMEIRPQLIAILRAGR